MASSKGGVGRTTLSAALAVRAVQRGRRVALIDRDPQEGLAAWADRGGRRSNPMLIDIDSTAEAIGLALAEPSFTYDFVIIDTPRSPIDFIEEAISQTDFVLIPCRASALDLVALDAVVDICRQYKKPYAFVLNAVHPKRKLTQTAPGVIRKHGHLCETMIYDRTEYVACMTVGKGPTEIERNKQAAGELDAENGALATRERFEPYVHARPRWVLQSRALAAALGAARSSAKHVARGVGSPSDDEGHEGHRLAVHAVLAHHPTPRRAAAELLEGRDWRVGSRP